MKPKLTEEDFRRAAERLRCEVPAIKAVAHVESRGAGFYADGFPVILFERHIFRRETKGKYSKTHPHLSGPAGNYGPAGKNQRVKFSQAFALDPEAAMKSCSWGKFQIMGFNHKACGYATVGEFVDAMKESEGKQLDAFVSFVISQRIDRPLREKNWTDFARSYNGKGYAKNRYDTKMADAYQRFLREPITSADDLPVSAEKPETTNIPPASATPAAEPPQEPTVHVTQIAAEKEADKEVSGIQASTAGAVTFITSTLGGLATFLAGFGWQIVVGVALFGGLFVVSRFWYSNREKERMHQEKMEREKQAHEVQLALIAAAADKKQNTVELVPPVTAMPNSDTSAEVTE